jgi:hypothetical protein
VELGVRGRLDAPDRDRPQCLRGQHAVEVHLDQVQPAVVALAHPDPDPDRRAVPGAVVAMVAVLAVDAVVVPLVPAVVEGVEVRRHPCRLPRAVTENLLSASRRLITLNPTTETRSTNGSRKREG